MVSGVPGLAAGEDESMIWATDYTSYFVVHFSMQHHLWAIKQAFPWVMHSKMSLFDGSQAIWLPWLKGTPGASVSSTASDGLSFTRNLRLFDRMSAGKGLTGVASVDDKLGWGGLPSN